MVLSMNIRSDRATNGDKSRSRGHRNKESCGNDRAKNLVDARSGIGGEGSGLNIEIEAAKSGHVEDRRASTLRGISVAPPETTG
jgi:hypothetical protein